MTSQFVLLELDDYQLIQDNNLILIKLVYHYIKLYKQNYIKICTKKICDGCNFVNFTIGT